MGYKQKYCLKVQAQKRMSSITCLGRSKHEDKVEAGRKYDQLCSSGNKPDMTKQEYINDAIRDKIYSINTYATYEKHNNYFFKYCEDNYKCKTLKDCRNHVDEWLKSRIDAGLSPYTIATEKAGLCKLYGEPASHFIDIPERKREVITRSREQTARDAHFSLKNNAEIINFCRGTGLRRTELQELTGKQLRYNENGEAVLSIRGKGGRYREALIIGPHKQEIIERIEKAGDGKVWEKVPSNMDVHSYRSDYATAIYTAYARDNIPYKERYYCRGDRKGEVMDRVAMQIASQALGHSRLEVVAGHYIR